MIQIKLSVPRLEYKFKKMQLEIMMVLAATMQTNRSFMFNKDGADNGKKKWKRLKWRDGRPLQNTGTLRRSFAPKNNGKIPGYGRDSIIRQNGNQITIGTKLLYAGMMNDGTSKMPGGVLRPKNAQALKIPMPKGKKIKGEKGKFMFRKSVTIPARPMDTITPADEKEFSETLSFFIAAHLNDEPWEGPE